MKGKKILIFIALLLIYFCSIPAYAKQITTGRVGATNNLNIRSGPGTGYSIIGSARYNTTVTILEDGGPGDGCSKNWIKITSSDNITGYVCSLYI